MNATTVHQLQPETMTALALGMGSPDELEELDGTMGAVLTPPEMVSWAAGIVAQAHATLANAANVIARVKAMNQASMPGYGWQCHPDVVGLAASLEQAFASVSAAAAGAAYAAHSTAYSAGGCSAARAQADQATQLAHGIYQAACGSLDAQLGGGSQAWGLSYATGGSGGGAWCLDERALSCVATQVDRAGQSVEHAASALSVCPAQYVARPIRVPSGMMGADDPGGGGLPDAGGGANVDAGGGGSSSTGGGTKYPPQPITQTTSTSNTGWWIAGAVVLLVLGGGAYLMWGR